jgi:hypothetical protein
MGVRRFVSSAASLRRIRVIAFASLASISLLASLAPVTPVAWAQTRKPPATSGKGRGTSKLPSKAPAAASTASDSGAFAAGVPASAPVGSLPAASPVDGGTVETKTLDGGTQVFKFKELDIEGRLKSPQLVYFLRRVRAEFAAGDLGHRSFMREMSETRKESSF